MTKNSTTPDKAVLEMRELIHARSRPMEVFVYYDGELQGQLEDLTRRLALAKEDDERHNRSLSESTAARIQAEIDEVAEQLEDTKLTLTVRALGRKRFNELEAEHPPHEDDVLPTGEKMDFHPDGFVPHLLAEAVDEFDLSTAQFVYDNWSDADVAALYSKAYVLNRVMKRVPFSVPATGGTLSSDSSSDTQ